MPITNDQEVSSYVMIHYFDDIYGQQLLFSAPPLEEGTSMLIKRILSRLVDVHDNLEFWQFAYTDKLFTSQNLKFSSASQKVRGNMQDFVISLILIPSNERVIAKTIDLWDYIPVLQEICAPYLFDFELAAIDDVKEQLYPQLKEITIEINQIFLLDV